MASTQLRIRKDLYWLIPSTITDNTGSFSTLTNPFYGKIDRAISGDTSTYINCSAGTGSYYFRLDPIMSIPTSVQIKIKYRMFNYDGVLPNNVTVLGVAGGVIELKVNNVTIGTITDTVDTLNTQDQTFSLTPAQASEILNTRNSEGYHYYELKFNVSSSEVNSVVVNQSARIYAIEIYFNNVGSETYNRTESYIGYTGRHYSTSANLVSGLGFINSSGSTSGYGESRNFVLGSTSGSGKDSNFIYALNDSSSYLPLVFNPITGYKVFEKVTRADLYLRYYNPINTQETFFLIDSSGNFIIDSSGNFITYTGASTSGGSNATDVFEVYGINTNFPNSPVTWGPGQFLSGSSGFYTVSAELTWLDNRASGTSGNNASAYFKSMESLSRAEYRIYGIPSGGRISAAELIIRTEDSNYFPLHILSSVVSGHTDADAYYTNTGRNLFRGNINKELFDKGYYALNEQSGSILVGSGNGTIYNSYIKNHSGLNTTSNYWTNYKESLPGAFDTINYRNALLINNNTNFNNYIRSDYTNSTDQTLYMHFTRSGQWSKLLDPGDKQIYYQRAFGNNVLSAKTDGQNLFFNFYFDSGPIELISPIYQSTQVLLVKRRLGGTGGGGGTVIGDGGGDISVLGAVPNVNMTVVELYTGPSYELMTLKSTASGSMSQAPIPNTEVYMFGGPQFSTTACSCYLHDFGFSSSGWSNTDIDLFNRSRHQLGYWVSPSGSDYAHYFLKNMSGSFSGYANNDAFRIYFDPGLEDLYEIDETEFDYSFLRTNPSGIYIDLTYSSSGLASVSGTYELYDEEQKYQIKMSGWCPSGNNVTKRIYPYTYETRSFEKTNPSTVFHFFDFDIAFPSGTGIYDIDYKLFSARVGIDAWDRIPYNESVINLYQGSATSESGIIEFYTANNYNSGYIDFFVSNNVEELSLNFHTYGLAPDSGSINFYTVNYTNEPSGINFNISGAYVDYNDFDLYIESATPIEQNRSIPLSVNSALNMVYDGLETKYIPIYIESNVDPEKNLNLFLKSDTGVRDGIVYFTISGEYENKVIDFYLKNTSSGNEKHLKLYTYGGTLPESGTLNMFIGRDGEGEFKYLNMTLGTDKYNTEDLNFYMFGAFAESGIINMYVSGKEIQTKQFDLFMGGF